ncbi:MAG: transcriptional repressor [Alphaproteobacteria bacterium]|nr:transcriptional repressor [Alphaproteobacteria bacterium]
MTASVRPFASVLERLKGVGLRPTRQRLALLRLLQGGGDRHLTAEDLHEEARGAGIKVSLATVYNTLHQFTEAGLLREVVVEAGRSYFDTNTSAHHHFLHEETGALIDIAPDLVRVGELPSPPQGTAIARVDVIVRVTSGNR